MSKEVQTNVGQSIASSPLSTLSTDALVKSPDVSFQTVENFESKSTKDIENIVVMLSLSRNSLEMIAKVKEKLNTCSAIGVHQIQPTGSLCTCANCGVSLTYPQGLSPIQCPQCFHTFSPQAQQSTTQCVGCLEILVFPSDAQTIRCPSCNSVMKVVRPSKLPLPAVVTPISTTTLVTATTSTTLHSES